MKKCLTILFVILISFNVVANSIATQSEFERNTGVGRLASTIEKVAGTEVNITNIVQTSKEPAEWIITLNSGRPWIDGNWYVTMTNKKEAPKGGFWFMLYDNKWRKIGICQAVKKKGEY